MAKQILVRPLITEKSEMLSDNKNQYSFVVHSKANKLEIKAAVQKMYDVKVASVNTLIMPAKARNRMTRSGVLQGKKSSYKKAIITLKDGETIDLYGEM